MTDKKTVILKNSPNGLTIGTAIEINKIKEQTLAICKAFSYH